MFRREFLRSLAGLAALLASTWTAYAQQWPLQGTTLFENVRVFDGKGPSLSEPTNVLVRGGLIEKISKDPIPVDRSATTTIIAGGGRTLMPGLIDAHWHTMLIRTTLKIRPMDPAWTLRSRMDQTPMAWLIQVNGFLVDARFLKREIQ